MSWQLFLTHGMVLNLKDFSKNFISVTINFFCSFSAKMKSRFFCITLVKFTALPRLSGSQSLLSKFHPSENIRREAGPPPNSLGRWLWRYQVEQGLLQKADAHRLLQTGQAARTDRSWIKAQQVCVLVTYFL